MTTNFGPFISAERLAAELSAQDLRIIDGSWRMPGNPPARQDYDARHIEGAIFFDIDEISDKSSDLPHMLPSAKDFSRAMGALGVSNNDRVVVYDDQGLFSAARVWWTFLAMGHRHVAVLDGGLRKWLAEGRPTTSARTKVAPAQYRASPRLEMTASAAVVKKAVHTSCALILDARPADRFQGAAPEPRSGLRSGHMPGARNLPFAELIGDDGSLLRGSALQSHLAEKGVAPDKFIITSCGSGVTAAILSLALETAGHERHSLYDGSWTEWADERNDDGEYPVITG